MAKLQLSLITIFLCAITTISSISKDHEHVVGHNNIQNTEVMLDIQDQQEASKKVQNKTSKYTGVSWNTNATKWQAQLKRNTETHYGGLFDTEEHAAMKVNLLCDKFEKERKHPMINIDLDAIQKVQNETSKYTAVCWKKDKKCWQVKMVHNKKQYHGGYFDNEEHAATKVNLLCDKYEIERKNPTINIDLDGVQRIKNQTSKYTGVSWNTNTKKWRAQLMHRGKDYFGGYFEIEEHAAMKINLLCDKIEMKRKHPMITIEPDEIPKVPNKTSIYTDVTWNKDCKKWRANLVLKGKDYFGGYFDIEEHAAMKINLICDKIEIKRKNPTIMIESDAIQRAPNQTSIYTGVTWKKDNKCWQVQLVHNKKKYHGGYFDNEEHAAMRVNLFCDKLEIKRKNSEINIDAIQKKTKSKIYQTATENIVNEKVKVEDENILNGFKDECENRFTQSNDKESCTATEFQKSNTKRKRKQDLILNDDVKEDSVEITTPDYNENDLLEYTKKHD